MGESKEIVPYPHQRRAIEYVLKHKHVLIGFRTGYGKTITSLLAAQRVGGRVLVLCPGYLKSMWLDTVEERFPDLEVEVCSNSHQVLDRVERNLKPVKTMIVDEIQWGKNPQAKRTQLLHLIVNKHKPEYLMGLSATPIKNHVGEFFSILWLLGYTDAPNGIKVQDKPKTLGSYWKWKQFFMYETQFYIGSRKVTRFDGFKNEKVLEGLLRGKYVTTRPEDSLDLPDKVVSHIDLDNENTELAEAWKRYSMGFTNEDEHISRAKANSALAKTKYTSEYVKGLLEANEQVLVFTDHVESAETLGRLTGNSIVITGSVDNRLREKYVEDFKAGVYRVLVATIGSASTGLNLVNTNITVFNDLPWISTDMVQAMGRIHRIGQDKTCFYYVVHAGPTDKLIWKTLERKRKLLEKVL